MMETPECAICEQPISRDQDSSCLRKKGCDSINDASKSRHVDIHVEPGQYVHNKCRKEHCSVRCIEAYTRKRGSESVSTEQESHVLRSGDDTFDYKSHCLLCGTPDPYNGRKKEFTLTQVRTFDFEKHILESCEKRNDEWSQKVKARIQCVNDLHAADALYHQSCNVNFRTNKGIPQRFQFLFGKEPGMKKAKLGRPKDEIQYDAFLKVVQYLEENDDEQLTVNDLIHKMSEHLSDTDADAYSFPYMKEKIQQEYGDKIIITEINGKSNIVTMWSKASHILHEFYSCPKDQNTETEKMRIIDTAIKLLKNDIKSLSQDGKAYPDYQQMSSVEQALAFLPVSLSTLLQGLISSSDANIKVASIGQAIVQATRPRVILSPLQLGLGVQMHHHFASKFLIDTLNKHGFSCSYHEVTKFERSAAVNHGDEIPNLTDNNFVQYVADNVDHNLCTLDGKNTFHGMGMIGTVTPATTSRKAVPRVVVTNEDLKSVGQIDIQPFISAGDGLQSLKYETLSRFSDSTQSCGVDLLWEVVFVVRPKRPGWSGMMQMVQNGDHPGPASVMFLPMIDLDPTDMNCVNSTLMYVSKHARQHGCTAILTFDQPLWWKGVIIQENSPVDSDVRSIILRLGGFHTEMSFLGSIGHLMSGTGLQELLEQVYASNTVGHMLSGKAVSRALRGNILASGAVWAKLLSCIFGVPLPSIENEDQADTNLHASEGETPAETDGINNEPEMDSLLITAGKLYDQLMDGSISVDNVEKSSILEMIQQQIDAGIDSMKHLRTAMLWIQYLKMVNLLKVFIKAERTGNWALHLQTLSEMLPYLAAAGHNNYTKSVYLYLQKMAKLPEDHPEVYSHFENGLHVVRRSDRYWAGLSTDLVIEQVLMRGLKTSGGLTHGRGMTETQRLVWVLSATACSEVNLAMQEFTSLNYNTSDQHKDTTKSRMEKDSKDTFAMVSFLEMNDPFVNSPPLCNIYTGVTAGPAVNVDCAKEVGEKVISSMAGKIVKEYTFRKKDKAVLLDSSSTISIRDETINIDPQLLFQRFVTAGMRTDDLAETFQFELCGHPPSLFDNKTTPRLANKSALADALWKHMPDDVPLPDANPLYVLDGGALLHRIPWTRGSTYDEISKQYVQYVTRHYGKPHVVFDGYTSGPSTKDATHQRRAKSKHGPVVQVSGSKVFTGKKDEFLANKENKQRFISILSSHLEQSGCQVDHARSDADVLIVNTALSVAERSQRSTILVADDTDILVLLCFHTNLEAKNLFLRPEPRKGVSKMPRCWNIVALKSTLGQMVCHNILFVHAILGCDTTSHIYGIGKSASLKLLMRSRVFQEQAGIFTSPQQDMQSVVTAGEHAMVALYNGQHLDKLDSLRLQRFHQKVSTSTSCVQPEVLPPTSAAAKYHSLRVYFQVQEWAGTGTNMNPEDWGWHEQNEKYLPVLTDKEPAPIELLEIIRCNCKTGCGSRQCGCRKHELECSSACGHCHGVCSNVTLINEDHLENDEFE